MQPQYGMDVGCQKDPRRSDAKSSVLLGTDKDYDGVQTSSRPEFCYVKAFDNRPTASEYH